jgi:hypothetical protein
MRDLNEIERSAGNGYVHFDRLNAVGLELIIQITPHLTACTGLAAQRRLHRFTLISGIGN